MCRKNNSAKANLVYAYDASGNRVSKTAIKGSEVSKTYYVRDASGNVMSTYTNTGTGSLITLGELYLYGSNRLGMLEKGTRSYELADHLGNVRAVVNEFKEVKAAYDYYPFGMGLAKVEGGYRYGFNGHEKDREITINYLSFNDYGYDTRLARRWRLDPLASKDPRQSNYNFASNSPLSRIDADGEWDIEVHGYSDRAKYGYGILIVKDNDGNEIARYQVLLRATNHPSRGSKGDTPTGSADISNTPYGTETTPGWRNDGATSSYGPNPRIWVDESSRTVQWKTNNRQAIQVHGKGKIGNVTYDEDSDQPLTLTQGCVRMNNCDIKQLKSLTDALKLIDPTDLPGKITITDDLEPMECGGLTYYHTPTDVATIRRINYALEEIDYEKSIENDRHKTEIDKIKSIANVAEVDLIMKKEVDRHNEKIGKFDERANELQTEKEKTQNQYTTYERSETYMDEK